MSVSPAFRDQARGSNVTVVMAALAELATRAVAAVAARARGGSFIGPDFQNAPAPRERRRHWVKLGHGFAPLPGLCNRTAMMRRAGLMDFLEALGAETRTQEARA